MLANSATPRETRTYINTLHNASEHIGTHSNIAACGEDTGVDFHRHDENWIAQVSGRKVWFLAPPEQNMQQFRGQEPCSFKKQSKMIPSSCTVHPGARTTHCRSDVSRHTDGGSSHGATCVKIVHCGSDCHEHVTSYTFNVMQRCHVHVMSSHRRHMSCKCRAM